MMKKIVSLLLTLALIFNMGITTFAGGTYTISLTTDSTETVVGTEAEPKYVYVTVSGNQDISSQFAQAYIKFDTEYLEFDKDASTKGSACEKIRAVKAYANGYHSVSVDLLSFGTPVRVNEGSWYTLAFKTLKAGTTTVSISSEDTTVFDGELNPLSTSTTDTITFTISEPPAPTPVTGITLNKTELSLSAGSSCTLTATVSPVDATNKDVNWSSSNEGVATVENGVVKAVAEGTTTITATTVDGGHTATCTVTVTPAVVASGYTIAVKDTSIVSLKGDKVVVKVMVSDHSDERITWYNAYDMYIIYDSDNLTFNKEESTVPDAGGTIDETEPGRIRITGHGERKNFETAVAILSFTARASGKQNVNIGTTQIDNSANAIAEDAPVANVPVESGTTEIKVPYEVKVPAGSDFAEIEINAMPGEDFSFAASPYYDITVTVDGVEVKPTSEGNTYTIPNVNGDIQISAVGKKYTVTVDEDTTANVTCSNKAQYGVDYSFNVTASSGKVIESVTATVNSIPVTLATSGGQYVIPGKSITGPVVISVTEIDSSSTETTTKVTIEGVEESEVVGGLEHTANVGEPFTFSLNKESGYSYIVKVGEVEVKSNADGSYTIPGTMIIAGGVTITIEKFFAPVAEVAVTNYIQLDEKVMWLITATAGDKVLAYGENHTMFWSDQYNAYCWLVISAENENAVKTAAQEAIIEAAEDADAATIAYDKDVNQTKAVDINDAQLTYDMYKAYVDFETVSMDKFLEADVNGDKTVNTTDTAAIVKAVLGK